MDHQQFDKRWRKRNDRGDDLIAVWKRRPRHSDEYAAAEIIEELESELAEERHKRETAEGLERMALDQRDKAWADLKAAPSARRAITDDPAQDRIVISQAEYVVNGVESGSLEQDDRYPFAKWILRVVEQKAARSTGVAKFAADALYDHIVREMQELPDRTSPDDWPEAMLITAPEVRSIIEGFFELPLVLATNEGLTPLGRLIDAIEKRASPNADALPRTIYPEEVKALRDYPNLQAMMQGCVSGQWTEWPMLRSELARFMAATRSSTREAAK